MVKRKFTPVQANRTLPLVRRIVADILEKAGEIREARKRPVRTDDARDHMASLEAQLGELMGELEQIGCSYKDWGYSYGLVDFPGQIDGEDVLLCWRTDEPRVEWFHPIETGFAGRRRIPPALLGDQPQQQSAE